MSDVQFRSSFYQFVPPWLRTGNAEKYIYTIEFMRDLLVEKSFQAMQIRLPGQGDVSQIPYLAFDRQLVQGPFESDASFIIRLQHAFETWNEAGSAIAVLGQLQTYAQGRQSVDKPQFTIVSNPRFPFGTDTIVSWWTLNYSDPIGTEPLLSNVRTTMASPQSFDWDHGAETWRDWLVIYQYTDAPHASGSSAATTTATGGSFTDPGHNVGGVWVPTTSGTPVNAPFLTVTGLSGLVLSDVGALLIISGSAHTTNNGTFQIAEVLSATSCVIVNKDGVAGDAGPLTWDVASYPWMPPGPAWGTPGLVWGEGEGTPPPLDTGSNVQGIWQSTTLGGAGELPSFSWGLYVDTLEIVTLRGLVKTWKSAGTYYPNIIICYDGDQGAYSRLSHAGTGNPDGTFGPVGARSGGAWVPTRLIDSPFDCYCQGTGRAVACSLENIT
jgi:hypothetical protein